MSHHPDISVAAGDDWEIDGSLLDVNGAPLDLTSVSIDNIFWNLRGSDGSIVLDQTMATISVVAPASGGAISIAVPAAQTGSLSPGRYVDALRVDIGGDEALMWTGMVLVDANPFGE